MVRWKAQPWAGQTAQPASTTPPLRAMPAWGQALSSVATVDAAVEEDGQAVAVDVDRACRRPSVSSASWQRVTQGMVGSVGAGAKTRPARVEPGRRRPASPAA